MVSVVQGQKKFRWEMSKTTEAQIEQLEQRFSKIISFSEDEVKMAAQRLNTALIGTKLSTRHQTRELLHIQEKKIEKRIGDMKELHCKCVGQKYEEDLGFNDYICKLAGQVPLLFGEKFQRLDQKSNFASNGWWAQVNQSMFIKKHGSQTSPSCIGQHGAWSDQLVWASSKRLQASLRDSKGLVLPKFMQPIAD